VTRLLPELYDSRFDEREVSAKDAVWREIVGYLQRYIDPDAPVLDIACDRGHFIRSVVASERWASDIRDVERHLPDDVRFIKGSGLHLAGMLPTGYFGTVFMSNVNTNSGGITVTGGASRNPAILQVMADVQECPVLRCEVTNGAALGAALRAAHAWHEAGGQPLAWEDVVRGFCDPVAGPPIRPRPETAAVYRTLLERYARLSA